MHGDTVTWQDQRLESKRLEMRELSFLRSYEEVREREREREGSQGEHVFSRIFLCCLLSLFFFFFFFLFLLMFLIHDFSFFAGVRYRGTGDYFRPLFAYFCDLELVS